MASKKWYTDIQLMNSVIKDSSGNTISLTNDEKLAVSNASSGPASQANPLTTKSYVDTEINSAVSGLQAGTRWREPVLSVEYNVSATAPATPAEGDVYVNSANAGLFDYTGGTWVLRLTLETGSKFVGTDGKVYTVTSGTLDAGTTPTVGQRYIKLADGKVYTCAEAGSWGTGEAPEANWAVVDQLLDETWIYDAEDTKWLEKSVGAIPDASKVLKGKVQIGDNLDVVGGVVSVKTGTETDLGLVKFAASGEAVGSKAVQGNDARLVKGLFSQNYVDVTDFEVTHNLNSSKLLVQVWCGNELIDASVTKKIGSETTVLQISLNSQLTVDVVVIALP